LASISRSGYQLSSVLKKKNGKMDGKPPESHQAHELFFWIINKFVE
jgi:hypothetical protein